MQHIIREGLRLQPPFSSQNLPGIKSEDTNRAGNCVSGVEEVFCPAAPFGKLSGRGRTGEGLHQTRLGNPALDMVETGLLRAIQQLWVN